MGRLHIWVNNETDEKKWTIENVERKILIGVVTVLGALAWWSVG